MSTYISPKANNFPGLDRGFNQRFKLDDNLSERQAKAFTLSQTRRILSRH